MYKRQIIYNNTPTKRKTICAKEWGMTRLCHKASSGSFGLFISICTDFLSKNKKTELDDMSKSKSRF